MQKANSLEKTLMLGKTEGWRSRWQRMRRFNGIWLNGYEFEQTSWDSEGQGSLVLQSMGLQRVRHDGATQQQGLQPSCQYSGDEHFPLVPCGDIFLVPIPLLTSPLTWNRWLRTLPFTGWGSSQWYLGWHGYLQVQALKLEGPGVTSWTWPYWMTLTLISH